MGVQWPVTDYPSASGLVQGETADKTELHQLPWFQRIAAIFLLSHSQLAVGNFVYACYAQGSSAKELLQPSGHRRSRLEQLELTGTAQKGFVAVICSHSEREVSHHLL